MNKCVKKREVYIEIVNYLPSLNKNLGRHKKEKK